MPPRNPLSKLTEEQEDELFERMLAFIQDTADPTVAKFLSSDELALSKRVTRHNLQDWTRFKELTEMAVVKQEAFLLEQGGGGKYNPTIAIFRLKQPQHGYSDRIDSDVTSGGQKLEVGLSANQAEQLIRARAARDN